MRVCLNSFEWQNRPLFWLVVYDYPRQHPWISTRERDQIDDNHSTQAIRREGHLS
jgi:hypothetical protein